MNRSTPLRRYARLKPRGDTKHARRQRDFAFMTWVRTQPCVARVLVSRGVECQGRIEANHIGGRYGADSDRRCVPMCSMHHQDWTGRVGGGGVFAGWSVERRREWGARVVAETLARYPDPNAWYVL